MQVRYLQTTRVKCSEACLSERTNVGGPGTPTDHRLAALPLVLPEMALPAARPPRELRTPQVSLPPPILYGCICVCEDGYLHMNEYELNDDDQFHFILPSRCNSPL
jgi:hypothetical protein